MNRHSGKAVNTLLFRLLRRLTLKLILMLLLILKIILFRMRLLVELILALPSIFVLILTFWHVVSVSCDALNRRQGRHLMSILSGWGR